MKLRKVFGKQVSLPKTLHFQPKTTNVALLFHYKNNDEEICESQIKNIMTSTGISVKINHDQLVKVVVFLSK